MNSTIINPQKAQSTHDILVSFYQHIISNISFTIDNYPVNNQEDTMIDEEYCKNTIRTSTQTHWKQMIKHEIEMLNMLPLNTDTKISPLMLASSYIKEFRYSPAKFFKTKEDLKTAYQYINNNKNLTAIWKDLVKSSVQGFVFSSRTCNTGITSVKLFYKINDKNKKYGGGMKYLTHNQIKKLASFICSCDIAEWVRFNGSLKFMDTFQMCRNYAMEDKHDYLITTHNLHRRWYKEWKQKCEIEQRLTDEYGKLTTKYQKLKRKTEQQPQYPTHIKTKLYEDFKCPICLRDKTEISFEDFKITKCGHLFCNECLSMCNTECPMCRANL